MVLANPDRNAARRAPRFWSQSSVRGFVGGNRLSGPPKRTAIPERSHQGSARNDSRPPDTSVTRKMRSRGRGRRPGAFPAWRRMPLAECRAFCPTRRRVAHPPPIWPPLDALAAGITIAAQRGLAMAHLFGNSNAVLSSACPPTCRARATHSRTVAGFRARLGSFCRWGACAFISPCALSRSLLLGCGASTTPADCA